jgi:hypothetical protein
MICDNNEKEKSLNDCESRMQNLSYSWLRSIYHFMLIDYTKTLENLTVTILASPRNRWRKDNGERKEDKKGEHEREETRGNKREEKSRHLKLLAECLAGLCSLAAVAQAVVTTINEDGEDRKVKSFNNYQLVDTIIESWNNWGNKAPGRHSLQALLQSAEHHKHRRARRAETHS